MSRNLKECIKELELVGSFKDGRMRKALLTRLAKKKCIYLALQEIAQNIINKNVRLSKNNYKALSKHRKLIRSLAAGKGKKHLKQRMIRQSGGFITAALPLILPLLGAVAKPLINAVFKKGDSRSD
jgi:hypothetical protein